MNMIGVIVEKKQTRDVNHEVWEDGEGNQYIDNLRLKGIGYQYETGKPPKKKFKKTLFPLDWPECDTITRATEYYFTNVNKSSMKEENNVIKLQNHECGVAFREGRKPLLNNEQTYILNKLASNIFYRNTVFLTTEDMAMILQVDKKKIGRTLKKLNGMIRVRNSKKGEWRVDINPMYAFKHPKRGFEQKRDVVWQSWVAETF